MSYPPPTPTVAVKADKPKDPKAEGAGGAMEKKDPMAGGSWLVMPRRHSLMRNFIRIQSDWFMY